jgi:hypothetical protein
MVMKYICSIILYCLLFPEIKGTEPDDFIKATHRVYHEKGNESYVTVRILIF